LLTDLQVIVSEAVKPEKRSKAELEQLVKANGGRIVQQETAAEQVICVADRSISPLVISLFGS